MSNHMATVLQMVESHLDKPEIGYGFVHIIPADVFDKQIAISWLEEVTPRYPKLHIGVDVHAETGEGRVLVKTPQYYKEEYGIDIELEADRIESRKKMTGFILS